MHLGIDLGTPKLELLNNDACRPATIQRAYARNAADAALLAPRRAYFPTLHPASRPQF